jgi:peptidoglycan hydrolase-like protein with peptidoglycan-binding domain
MSGVETFQEREIHKMIKSQVYLLALVLMLSGLSARVALSEDYTGVSHTTVKKVQEDLKDKGYYNGSIDGLLGPQTREALRHYQAKEHLAGDGRLTRETWDHLNAGSSTVDDHFEEAGQAIEEHYGQAGKSVGEGSKDLGKEVKKGEVTEGAKDFGKGVGGFGKEVGKGTAKGAKKVAEGVKDVFDGDANKSNATRKDDSVEKAQQALKGKGYYTGEVDGVMGPATQSALKRFQEKEGLAPTGQLSDETKKKLGMN